MLHFLEKQDDHDNQPDLYHLPKVLSHLTVISAKWIRLSRSTRQRWKELRLSNRPSISLHDLPHLANLESN